jgi:hypothetical protein
MALVTIVLLLANAALSSSNRPELLASAVEVASVAAPFSIIAGVASIDELTCRSIEPFLLATAVIVGVNAAPKSLARGLILKIVVLIEAETANAVSNGLMRKAV